MTTKIVPGIGALLCGLFMAVAPAFAQGTAFTYQGRLNDGANPAGGIYDLRFSIFDALSAGTQQGNSLTNPATAISNGLFTVTLDFGNQFPGANRWLEIGVRTNGNGTFSTLSPRQKITPVPYATYAAGASAAGINGTIPTANLAGIYGSAVTFNNAANSFSGNGTGLTNVNAGTLGGFGAASFWNLGGNSGTVGAVLGTFDNQPLTLYAGGRRALQLETKSVSLALFQSLSAVNTLGGASGNVISNGVMGGTIAGGGAVTNFLFGSAAAPNTVLDNFGTVGGGINNTAGSAGGDFDDTRSATVAGGENNTAGSAWTTVGGGFQNTSGTLAATVGGGGLNTANGGFATVSGGYGNTSSGDSSTIPGGLFNQAVGVVSFAAGDNAQALHDGTFVWADLDSNNTPYASTGTNQFCVRARGGIQVEPQTSMFFGTQTRQMLNLSGSQYGIGVQGATLYFRVDNVSTSDGFSWYKGGVHNDNYAQPGAGGVELMHLVQAGLYVNGTFVSSSDRNVKQDFADVNSRAVLEKVAQLPIQTWAYKNDPGTKHLGPVAQDFYAAFAVGPDDKHITTVDESGVALAAIQGLNRKLEEKLAAQEIDLHTKEIRLRTIEQKLADLEALLAKLSTKEK